MIDLELTHNFDDVGRGVQAVFNNQMPFATAQAINDSGRQAQKVQRAHQLATFDAHRPSWLNMAVKLKPMATKQKAVAKLSIDPPRGRGGRSKASILTQHEEDARKLPVSGGYLAVPTRHVPVTAAGVIRSAWRPRNLKKRKFREGFRTFVRQTSKGRAIFFDEGSQGGGIVPLYWLVRAAPLDQRLDFLDNVTKSVLQTYDANFVKRFDQATRSAR